MMNWLLFTLFWHGASFPNVEFSAHVAEDSLTIRILNYEQLKPMLHQDNDTTYVVNFWATWCSPCMAELPYFLELDSLYAGKPMKLVLISLDFKKDYLRKLQPFVKSKNLEDNVVVLEDNNANFWINDIEPSWGGAIPATLVYKGSQRSFYERTFHHVDELKEIVKPYLN
jgi:thiol-disulfide isomerase/thioredoxin